MKVLSLFFVLFIQFGEHLLKTFKDFKVDFMRAYISHNFSKKQHFRQFLKQTNCSNIFKLRGSLCQGNLYKNIFYDFVDFKFNLESDLMNIF